MTKAELILLVAVRNPHLTQRHAEQIVETIFEEISEALISGARVELRGFGTFYTKQRKARTGRNPRTGKVVQIAPKRKTFFRIGKTMHEHLNGIEK